VVSFEVTNLGIAKRQGVFKDVTGTVLLDPQGGNGSIDIVVNARSIKTGDAATQAFVRGKSFLNVDEYSEIAYRAERVVFADGKPVRIEGKLTLLGVTKDVSLAVSGYECSDTAQCVLDAAATFKRSEFGMNRYLALVSDSVRLAIHGVATSTNDERYASLR
jgi:polyisoprenoid-binding protein YceI